MAKKNSGNKVKKRRFYKRKRFWFVLLALGLAGSWFGYVFVERYTRPFRERANTDYDLTRIGKVEEPSIIYGRDGGELGRIFVQNRSVVSIDQVPQIFIDALRAGEDKRFYQHHGVDYLGIARAAYDWWKAGEAVSGASTITQQLARGAYDLQAEADERGESSIERKIVEAFLALRIEKHFSKREILELYLNRIYFGSGYYGIRSASLGYFGKEPAELNATEAATMVGLIKNPSTLSPLNDKERSRVARDMVLERMANIGVISNREATRMKHEPIVLDPKPLQRGTSHLYERIADEIRRLVGEESLAEGGFAIHTTIDSRVQQAAEKALEESLRKAETHEGYAHPIRADYVRKEDATPEYLQGAVLMIDHLTGRVVAHVGGRDYADAPFDFIELGRRPLGTAFHPILYAAALEGGMTPATKTDDIEIDQRTVMIGGSEGITGEWGMETPTPRYEGEITLRRALESSKIAASVRVANEVGLGKVVEQAEAFGLPMAGAELLPRLAAGWESASLKQLVRAYAAFARAGRTGPAELHFVERIKSADGLTRYQREELEPQRLQAVSDATAFLVHNILQSGMVRGSASGLLQWLTESPFNGAGKPGTTHDFSDNWFVGYNARVACGVWIGFLQPGKSIYQGAFARNLAMPVWATTMNAAAGDFGGRGIPAPRSVVAVEVCRVSGQRATPYCYEMAPDAETGQLRSRPAAITEYFRRGTENVPFCEEHSGAVPINPVEEGIDITRIPLIDTSPVVPKEPTLLGDDPYHAVFVNADNAPKVRRRIGRTNVLDSFDLDDRGTGVTLPQPERLEILPE